MRKNMDHKMDMMVREVHEMYKLLSNAKANMCGKSNS